MMKQIEGVKPLQFQAWVGFVSVWPLAALSAWLEPGQVQTALHAGWPFAAAALYSALLVSVFAHTIYYLLIGRYEANPDLAADADDAAGDHRAGRGDLPRPLLGRAWRSAAPSRSPAS